MGDLQVAAVLQCKLRQRRSISASTGVNPELLDWLAWQFVDSGWNVKDVVRLLVMSSAYRQASDERAELQDRDPENRWCQQVAIDPTIYW